MHHKEFMDDIQSQFVEKILAGTQNRRKEQGSAFAPSNIALCKYWGKRDATLNLPINSSLSVSLGKLGTRTEIFMRDDADCVYLNGELQSADNEFAKRVSAFLDLFRPTVGKVCFEVRTENNIPTAAGLASSASGFAALVMALDDWAGWGLDKKRLSMLARLGSGSASRSVCDGFVQWHAGTIAAGTDSFAEKLPNVWPAFRIGVLELSSAQKPVGSRDGMNRTVETSELYKSWPAQAAADLATIRAAIDAHDLSLLGRTAERNALSMHATMMSAWPPLLYLQPESVEQIHKVQRVRADGLEVYLTIDAGPNIKLLFLEENEGAVSDTFPGLQTIPPFE
jgi:diphosphomevalonate decarboxylase